VGTTHIGGDGPRRPTRGYGPVDLEKMTLTQTPVQAKTLVFPSQSAIFQKQKWHRCWSWMCSKLLC